MTAKQQAAAMLATAQALAARPDCPKLPAMYVVSKGEPAYYCSFCGAEDLDADDSCCAGDGEDFTEQEWPDAVRLADLTSDANGGVLLGLLREAGVLVALCWSPLKGELGGWHVTVTGHSKQCSEHLGHAAAKAWLAWREAMSISHGERP